MASPPPNNPDDPIWSHYTKDVKRLRPHAPATPKTEKAKSNAAKPVKPSVIAAIPKQLAIAPTLPPLPQASHKISVQPPDRQTQRKIKRGVLPIEGEIDLHGMTQIAAYTALHAFVKRAYAKGWRRVRVITGKGGSTLKHSHKEPGILRRNVPIWLGETELKRIISGMHNPPESDGGTGALIVTLKKNPTITG